MTAAVQSSSALGAAPADETAKIKAAADQFEGFFIGQLLREMRRSTREIAGDDSIYHSPQNDDMLDLADVALGNSLAHQHAFGIADAILRQMLPAQFNEPGKPVASNKE